MYVLAVRIKVIVEGYSKLLCNVTECSMSITFQQYYCVYVSQRYECMYDGMSVCMYVWYV